MGFLNVSKGKPSTSLSKGKVDSSLAKVGQEAFDFIYEKSPDEGARPGERCLELAHFEPLATAVDLKLEDLSLHLLAFLADESSKTIFKIAERRFVAWMSTLAASLPRTAEPPTRDNGFASLFRAAHTAVIDLNARLRTSEEQRVKFYHFLYHWCLKGNTGTDRVEIAKELWSCFFSASPLSFSNEEAKLKFTAYVCFPRINQWLNFITLQAEKAKETKQGGAALDQIGVSFDTWSQLIPFSKMTSYSEYDDEDSWPVAMDDFVEYALAMEKDKKMEQVSGNLIDVADLAAQSSATTIRSRARLQHAAPHAPLNSPLASPAPLDDPRSAASQDAPNAVLSLFRRLLAHSTDDGASPSSKALSKTSARPQRWRGNEEGVSESEAMPMPPLVSARPHRLKVAVVGEAESGRTALCKSLEDAARGKTQHPLVVSGRAAALKMDASVLSVQTFDVAQDSDTEDFVGLERRKESGTLEVTVVDSGPAPLSEGAGPFAVMEADVVLLCLPLYGIKQVVPRQATSALDLFRSPKPTEAFIHARDYQLLTTLLTLLSTRCGGAGDQRSWALPSVFLVGTFHDALKDASVAATHTILRALQRLCDRARQRSPAIPPVTEVFAISAVQSTSVSLASEKQLSLSDWWRCLLHRAAAADQPLKKTFTAVASGSLRQSEGAALTISLSALRHVLGHPNRLHALNAGVRQISSGHGSPRLLDVGDRVPFAYTTYAELASAETRAEDAHTASLVIDFVTQLKARKRVWMLPLPKLWRVAYALGMQTREQLYLVARQMEATGEVLLLGRGLSYAQQSRAAACAATNETVCLCPALLRTSYSILYVYADWVAHRQRRHLRRCLRGVDLDECALRDPHGYAAKGCFPLPLLRCLALALGLKGTSLTEAAELLISVLVGVDAAYIDREKHCEQDPVCFNDSLHPPMHSPASGPPSSPSSTLRADLSHGTAVSPPRSRVPPLSLAESTGAMTDGVSPSSSMGGDLPLSSPLAPAPAHDTAAAAVATASGKMHRNDGFSSNITVAEFTSVFLLGELTSTASVDASASSSTTPSRLLSNASFDPVRVAMQRTGTAACAALRGPCADDSVTLVVPNLQPSALCPDTVKRHVLSVSANAARASTNENGTMQSSQVRVRVDPLPYDLVSLLTCHFASVALRVEKAYSNAVLLSFNVAQLLRPTTDYIPLCQLRPATATKAPADGCCFIVCEPPTDATTSCSAVLRLISFASSATRVARLECALSTELRMFLLQRLPGMTIAPLHVIERVEDTAPLGECVTVEDLIRSVRKSA